MSWLQNLPGGLVTGPW